MAAKRLATLLAVPLGAAAASTAIETTGVGGDKGDGLRTTSLSRTGVA